MTIKWNVSADRVAFPDFDPANCIPDPDRMKYSPVKLKLTHYDPQTSLRKILWHEDDLVTDVSTFPDQTRNELTRQGMS